MSGPRNIRFLAVNVFAILSLAATVASSAPYSPGRAAGGSDVSVSILADRSTVKAGQNITYTVTMTNLGPEDASFTDVAFAIPDGLQMVSMTCDQGVSPDGPFCEYWSLPAGASLVSVLVATPQMGTPARTRTVKQSVSVLFESIDTVDPNLANNTAAIKTKLIGRLHNP